MFLLSWVYTVDILLESWTTLQFSNFYSVVEVNVFTLLEQFGEFSLNDTVVMDASAEWLKVNDIEPISRFHFKK